METSINQNGHLKNNFSIDKILSKPDKIRVIENSEIFCENNHVTNNTMNGVNSFVKNHQFFDDKEKSRILPTPDSSCSDDINDAGSDVASEDNNCKKNVFSF